MSVLDALKQARAHLAGGWISAAEPLPPWADGVDRAGAPVFFDDEGIWRFTVAGALRLACPDDLVRRLAWDELERLITPLAWTLSHALRNGGEARALAVLGAIPRGTFPQSADAWLDAPTRALPEILRVFDVAILNARKLEAA